MTAFRGAVALLALAVLPGCVSAKYKQAPKNTPPAVAINLTATDPSLSAVLHTVIVFQGPGSWKRNAYWDEYVFTVANYGSTPLVLQEVELYDFTKTVALPGDNPWTVEKQSRSGMARLQSAAGTTLKIGAATLGVAAVSIAPLTATSAGFFIATPATVAVGALAAPAFLVGTVVRNVNHRGRIEREFVRRRLVLPVTLAPGEIRQGSLFFRISPGPSRLALRYANAAGETGVVEMPLEALASLHLKRPLPAWQKPEPYVPHYSLKGDRRPRPEPPPEK